MRTPKRLKGCEGCIYYHATDSFCDYHHITGKLRSTQKAPLLPGGGCRLKEEGAKVYNFMKSFGKYTEITTRHRVTLPNGKVKYLTDDEYERFKRGEYQ